MPTKTLYEEICQRRYAFYAKLQKRQSELHLTYDEIANRSGVEADKIGRFMRGDAANPSLFRVEAVCQVLGVSPDMELGNECHADAESVSLRKELENARELADVRKDMIETIKKSNAAWRVLALSATIVSFVFVAAFFILDRASEAVGFIQNGKFTAIGWVFLVIVISILAALSITLWHLLREKK